MRLYNTTECKIKTKNSIDKLKKRWYIAPNKQSLWKVHKKGAENMYSFTKDFDCAVSSSVCREEASSACSQCSSASSVVIVMGISVLMSIFAVMGMAYIMRDCLSIIICIIIMLAVLALAIRLIIDAFQLPAGGKPYFG